MKSEYLRSDTTKGFTLIELMIALAIGSAITGMAYLFFTGQSRSVATEMKRASIQQNLRAAMFILEQEIKKIGYNPSQIRGGAAPGIIAAGPGWLSFQADLNENGAGFNGYGGISGVIQNNETDPGEIISIGIKEDSYGNGDEDGDGIADSFPSRLWRDTSRHHLVIADNIEVINFEYLDNRGMVLPQPSENMGKIKQIQVTIIARAGSPAGGYKNSRTYYNPRQKPIFKASGDGFIRGLSTKTIYCRNLMDQP